MARGSFYKFGEATIHHHSRDFLARAEIFVSFMAEFAFAARPVNPWNAYSVTDLELSNIGAFFNDAARDFMSRDQWHFRDRKELRPVSIDYMQIRMAEAASLNLNEHLVRFQQRTRDILEHQSFFEFVQNSGLHCLCLEDKNRLILS